VRHTRTAVILLFWNLSGTTRVSRYQKGETRKGKTNLDLLEQEIVSGSDICWAICKSAPHPRQPCQHPTTQFFTGQMLFLPSNQQNQSTVPITSATSTNKWLHHFVHATLNNTGFLVYPLLTTSTLYWIITNTSTTDTTWPSYSLLRYLLPSPLTLWINCCF